MKKYFFGFLLITMFSGCTSTLYVTIPKGHTFERVSVTNEGLLQLTVRNDSLKGDSLYTHILSPIKIKERKVFPISSEKWSLHF